MARLVVDVRAASVPWAGRWWAAYWGDFPLGVHRDPGRVIARTFLKAGKAKADDVIILRLEGVVIDEEPIGEASRRKVNPERMATRLLLATLPRAETPAQ
jgi:hypothetical protein